MLICVTGAAGMLGSQVWRAVKNAGHEAIHTSRPFDIAAPDLDGKWVLQWTDEKSIDLVINCAGVATPGTPERLVDQKNMVVSNSLGPHALAEWCNRIDAKLVHVSTDCVFSGDVPELHDEGAPTDPKDLYGRSKLAGEVFAPHVMNVRGSFVGWQGGLLAWLLQQRGDIQGWTNGHWSGLYVSAYARILVRLAELFEHQDHLNGIIHVPGPQWRKSHLLEAVAEKCRLPVRVMPTDNPIIYRALMSLRWADIPIEVPNWATMLEEVRHDFDCLAGRS